jgi:dephospho-CoA kinase
VINIALTGNIASGKSTVAGLLARWGATVIDADQLTREVQAPGTPTLAAIAAAFGPTVLRADGALDRARLRAIVLADPARRRDLEAIVHPAVAALRERRAAEAAAGGARIVVSDIPLLFESLDPAAFDAVLLVEAPDAVRLERLRARSGLGANEARALMATQMPSERKRAWRGPRGEAAIVIENGGDLAQLEARTRAVWELLTAGPA